MSRNARWLNSDKTRAVLFMMLFLALGTATLLLTRAASRSISFELERSSNKSGVRVASDPNASGGQFIQFQSQVGSGAANCTTSKKTLGSMAEYAALPGDQIVIVPNGTYKGTNEQKSNYAGVSGVSVSRAATNNPCKGWLVLKAETPGGVTIDLEKATLRLNSDTSRIMFVGFKFINGSIYNYASDIIYWRTEHIFTIDSWVSQSANPLFPEDGYYRAPRAIYMNSQNPKRNKLYGVDVHDTATALMPSGSEDTLVQGVKTWNLSDRGKDPQDAVHPDAIGNVGGSTIRLKILNSWIKGRVMIIDAPGNNDSGGPNVDLLFKDSWFSDSPSAGFTFTSRRTIEPRGTTGKRENIRTWGHSNGHDRIEIISDTVNGTTTSKTYYAPNFNTKPDRVNVIDSNVDKTEPTDKTKNPADAWRQANSYDSWSNFLY